MRQMLKLAWGSLLQHRIRTLISGAVLFFGALLLFSGRAISAGVVGNLEKMVTGSFTGDLVILSDRNGEKISLMDFRNMEMITNSHTVLKQALSVPVIDGGTVMGKGVAMIEGDGDQSLPTMLLGVDGRNHGLIFPRFRLLSGTAPDTGQGGIWINESYLQMFLRGSVKVGDTLSLTAPTRSGFMNARRVRVRGIFRLDGLEGLTGLINIMDMKTYRNMVGMRIDAGILSAAAKRSIRENRVLLDSDGDPEKMLSTSIINQQTLAGKTAPAQKQGREDEKRINAMNSRLSEYIALRLKPGIDAADTASALNQIFKKKKMGVTAWTWQETSGQMGDMITMLQIILIVLAMVVFAMLIIIIMNSMVMTAIERTYEVGTMRAIGASRSFILRLFFSEALLLGGIFGGAGAATAALILDAYPGIPATSMVTRMLFGGEILRIPVTSSNALETVLMVVITAVLAAVYPARVAAAVPPVRAMQEQ